MSPSHNGYPVHPLRISRVICLSRRHDEKPNLALHFSILALLVNLKYIMYDNYNTLKHKMGAGREEEMGGG